MKWSWEPRLWKRSTKLLLGFATAWPYVYVILFIGGVLAITLFLTPKRGAGSCGDISPGSLEYKIRNRELKELVVTPTEILSRNRAGTCQYRTWLPNENSQKEILRKARELDADGVPFVTQISEEAPPNASPIAVTGFVAVFALHMLTVVMVLGLIAIYIVLAIKNQQMDQTTKIGWVVGMCLVNMIAMPAYWYLYVWRQPSTPKTSATQDEPSSTL